MIKKVVIGLFAAVLLASCSINARLVKADKKFALGEYYIAADKYRSLYSVVSSKDKKLKGEVAFKSGNSYRILGNIRRAQRAFKNAIRYKYADSIVYYYYADILRKSKKYASAKKMYIKYQTLAPKSILAANGIISCDSALASWKVPSRYIVKKETHFNPRRSSNFCPALASKEGDMLYFNSTRSGKKSKNSKITGKRDNDIYTCRTNIEGKWEEVEYLESEINTSFDEGSCSFSADGQELFYTQCIIEKGKTLGASIYSCKRTGGDWGDPELLKILADSSVSVAHPTLSPNGEYLYFVSDMEGTYGGKDIWRTKRSEDGWSIPENLGPELNTAGNEMFPYYRSDGRFYFSSDGHPGFGGLDLFVVEKVQKEELDQEEQTTDVDVFDEEKWTLNNLLAPINSSMDDFGICFAGDQERGFFSTNRGDRKYYDHIWSFNLPYLSYTIEGLITDEEDEILSDAVVKIVGDDGSISSISTSKDGSYIFNAHKNTNYVMMATCRGYLNSKEELSTVGLDRDKAFNVDYELTSITKPVKMDNIFFEFGSAELTSNSYSALDKLVKLLNDNPNVTIEVSAHTDMIGSEEQNLILSQERAQTVTSYLETKGIVKERLTPIGYGEAQPVIPDRDLVTTYRFMRVGVPLDEKYILKLKEGQREKVNRINRRTEFKVLKTTYKMY